VNLSVTGQSIFDFTITEWTDAAGTVASDGRSASFAGSGNNEPFVFLQGNEFFGCTNDACSGSNFSELALADRVIGQLRFFDYTSPEAALASMRMTASATAIPLPAGLPLLLAGLGALGLMRRAQPAIAPTVMIHPNGGAPLS
ncbi:MAG: VPLPA-CTERM sorting domain-containing protein, partial [Pseudomonadota bacterium]